MQINFIYNKSKDVWCLLNKGKNSNNSSNSTKQYELLITKYGENPSEKEVEAFIDKYIVENNINVDECMKKFRNDWEHISTEFHKRAETIFSTTLPETITAYLTINSRCPYNIQENFFFVSIQETQARRVAMHELWHFYTWYGLGADQRDKLGEQKYNTLKEALTAILNVECEYLLSEGLTDTGYPQHQEIRHGILAFWKRNKNITKLWDHFVDKA
jgi:hypothetical protein